MVKQLITILADNCKFSKSFRIRLIRFFHSNKMGYCCRCLIKRQTNILSQSCSHVFGTYSVFNIRLVRFSRQRLQTDLPQFFSGSNQEIATFQALYTEAQLVPKHGHDSSHRPCPCSLAKEKVSVKWTSCAELSALILPSLHPSNQRRYRLVNTRSCLQRAHQRWMSAKTTKIYNKWQCL